MSRYVLTELLKLIKVFDKQMLLGIEIDRFSAAVSALEKKVQRSFLLKRYVLTELFKLLKI